MLDKTLRNFTTACAAALLLAGCGGMPRNRGLDSVHQPVVEQRTYTLDLAVEGGNLAFGEQQRLAGWFEALNLGHGDRIGIDDPAAHPAVLETVATLADRRGMLVAATAPPTPGEVGPGTVRVVVRRFRAHVPGCPDWSAKSDVNLGNGTYPNFGCAVNGTLAAMVADPADLIRGQSDNGTTVTMTGTKAIESYRTAPPTGAQGLRPSPSTGGAGGGSEGTGP